MHSYVGKTDTLSKRKQVDVVAHWPLLDAKGKEHVPTTGGKESRHTIKPATNLRDRSGLISMRFGQIKRTQIKRQLAGMQSGEKDAMETRVKFP
jgi:DNA repair ATPase RecN